MMVQHSFIILRQTSLSSPWLDQPSPLGGNWSPNRRPVVAKNADGRLEVFMIGLDGRTIPQMADFVS